MLGKFIEQISDDFQSTFTLVNPYQMYNMMGLPNDFENVTKIIQKYIPNAQVKFQKTNQFKNDYDIYVVTILPNGEDKNGTT